jgi:hypothetical protein
MKTWRVALLAAQQPQGRCCLSHLLVLAVSDDVWGSAATRQLVSKDIAETFSFDSWAGLGQPGL